MLLLLLVGVLTTALMPSLFAQPPAEAAPPTALELVNQIQSLLDTLRTSLTPPPPPGPTVIHVQAGSVLQPVVDAAPAGAVLALEPGLYDGAVVLRTAITLQPSVDVPAGRATRTSAPVILRSAAQTITVTGADVTLVGLTVQSTDASQTIVMITGARVLLDRVVVLGDPVHGQHRGIAVNGAKITLRRVYVDDCWLIGRDAQAVSGWDGTADLLIEDSYLAGGAETVMFGGADPSSEAAVPQRITIHGSTLSKNPAWYALGAQIKCAFELKDAVDVIVLDSILEYAGISGGSTGYVILLTPRNPGNTAPYSSVQHVRFERLLVRHGGGGVSMLGQDDTRPSGPLNDVTFKDVAFQDLDPIAGPWKGQGRVFQFNKSPQHVTFDGVTVVGANLSASFYFIRPPIALVVHNVVLPTTKYGVKIDGGGSGWPALLALAPDTIVDLAGPGAQGVPTPSSN